MSSPQSTDLVLGVIRPDCQALDKMLGNTDNCFQFTFLKVLSIAIIAAAFLFKLPQIFLILKSESVKGISRRSVYAEVMSYFNTLAYARHLGYGVALYGETILITIQNCVVVLCMYRFDSEIRRQEKMLAIGMFLLYATVLLHDVNVTEQVWAVISTSVIFLSLFSRGSQIYENYRNKSTG